MSETPDLVTLDDYEVAVERLVRITCGTPGRPVSPMNMPGPVGRAWLERAADHLARKVDAYLRETPRIDTEKQAVALVKGVALDLHRAGAALKVAAEQLKGAGKGFQANQAYTAHKAAIKTAQQWLQVGANG